MRSAQSLATRQAWLAVAAAAALLATTQGFRATLGLFVSPLNTATGLGLAVISFALAASQLAAGFAQPVAGRLAERYGPGRLIAGGAVASAACIALVPSLRSGPALTLGFVLLAISGTLLASAPVLIAAVVERVPAAHRGRASGLVGAGGSAGQLVLGPTTQAAIVQVGWVTTLHLLAGLTLVAGALAVCFRRTGADGNATPRVVDEATLRAERAEALRDRRFWYVAASFFACGFHVSFLLAHMPGFVAMCGLPVSLGGAWLAILGVCNVLGSIGAGMLVERIAPRLVLTALHALRAAIVLVFAMLPPSVESVIVFSIAIGTTYMATLPATTAVVGNLYGTRHLGVLFGIVMIVHQAGSFLGVWLGGVVIDVTGRYDALWAIDAALAIGATVACLAIGDDRARRWRLAPRPPQWSLVPRALGR